MTLDVVRDDADRRDLLWEQATALATTIADVAQPFGVDARRSWDYRLVHDTVAVYAYALALRDAHTVVQVGLGSVLGLLLDESDTVELLRRTFGEPAPETPAVLAAPAGTVQAWQWLSIEWGPHRVPDAPCGIAAGRPVGTGCAVGGRGRAAGGPGRAWRLAAPHRRRRRRRQVRRAVRDGVGAHVAPQQPGRSRRCRAAQRVPR
ncbi:hypothetical protein AB0M46_21465 [Dactylosporangium sp. NPDC051485]|uniref:hypothetical protein n=1 Tax=Dactylosporangium sp. NPDC051485 TaxID=3154846 RepID=UPI0034464815